MWSQVGLRKPHYEKVSRGNGIPVELFQILKHDAVKVLNLICSKCGKFSSGHRTGKGQFLFQSQTKWSEVKLLSCVWLFVTPWTVAHQDSPSMEFSRQEYWSALSFPSPGDLPDSWIKPRSPASQADTLLSEPLGNPQSQRKAMPNNVQTTTQLHSFHMLAK